MKTLRELILELKKIEESYGDLPVQVVKVSETVPGKVIQDSAFWVDTQSYQSGKKVNIYSTFLY